mmetsp:Transcript_8480/g.18713  ORF Transcript_8480/g.18713 Transcript_8480/m.18713 type:complete len:516 (+) Transcript_8480:68-1615(+)
MLCVSAPAAHALISDQDGDTSNLLQQPRCLRCRASFCLLAVILITGAPFLSRGLIDKIDGSRIISKNSADEPRSITSTFHSCYSLVSNATCQDQGQILITEPSTCRDAGVQLGLSSATLQTTDKLNRPYGCYWFQGNGLWLATNPDNYGSAAVGLRSAICLANHASCLHADMALQKRVRNCFSKVSGASCEDKGSLSITRAATCRFAKEALFSNSNRFSSTTLRITPENQKPLGCYLDSGKLWLAYDSENAGNHAIGGRESMCIKQDTWCLRHSKAMVIPRLPSEALPSLFCWVITLPHGPEPKVIIYQFVKRMGIFACNAHAVFSERATWLVPGDLRTTAIGQIKSTTNAWLLNVHVFMRAWRKVKASGRYLKCDWTIKVDPDTVWFPHRLRPMLRSYSNPDDYIYFANCNQTTWHHWSMQGPIEILSRGAVWKYTHGSDACLTQIDLGFAGEDIFADRCLKLLGARKELGHGLLSDLGSHCFGSRRSCTADFVAYHHFKTPKAFFDCVSELRH